MKPISEYNFREIVGKFVIIYDETDLISSEYNSFIAYCYIDIEKGISFKIYGGLTGETISVINDKSITLLYADDILIDLYNPITDDMVKFSSSIENIYAISWIDPIRKDTDFDHVRDHCFPDDMCIPICTDYLDSSKTETLWVRPVRIQNGRVVVELIEDGKIIKKGLQALLLKEINKEGSVIIFAVTADWLEKYNDEIEKQN